MLLSACGQKCSKRWTLLTWATSCIVNQTLLMLKHATPKSRWDARRLWCKETVTATTRSTGKNEYQETTNFLERVKTDRVAWGRVLARARYRCLNVLIELTSRRWRTSRSIAQFQQIWYTIQDNGSVIWWGWIFRSFWVQYPTGARAFDFESV